MNLMLLLRRLWKYVTIPLLFAVAVWAGYFLLYGNFHKVDKDFYRSAQLFSFNFPYYVQKYEIKSILNLRGASRKQWYKDEVAMSQKYHVIHYDYGIVDRRMISLKEMNEIVDIIKKAPKPILIHCKAGADRTSLVSALYLYAIKHDSNAERAISIIYGHFPWLGSKTGAMDRSFQKYKQTYQEKE
jgi:protein tyrosine/serine phosphatase